MEIILVIITIALLIEILLFTVAEGILKVVSEKKSIENRADHIPDSSKKVSTPIYRGKKVDSDEYVEGFLVELEEMYYIATGKRGDNESESLYLNHRENGVALKYFDAIHRDTLAISFDDSKTWYSLDEVNMLIGMANKISPNCDCMPSSEKEYEYVMRIN